jgi:23S rRNA pseudouridine955/2504/2580 synthase
MFDRVFSELIQSFARSLIRNRLMNNLLISENEANQRLDKFLLKYMNKSTKSFIYKMLRKKRIKLNGKKAEGSEMLCAGDRIKFYLSDETMDHFMEEKRISQGAGKLDVIFEDENILVCNKEAGVLSQPEKPSDRDTVVDRLLYYLSDTGQYIPEKTSVFTPAICNRLDRNTSGLMLCGKNLPAVQALNEAIRNRRIEKYYIAAVHGRIDENMILSGKHLKNTVTNTAVISDETGGSEILTEIEPMRGGDRYTVLRIKLITGKTHQIRAHMQSIGHPVIGDRKYGGDRQYVFPGKENPVSHQLLHANEVVFKENSGKLSYLYDKKIVSPLPLWYKQVIAADAASLFENG